MKNTPIEAVILGLDPAKHRSGACILMPDYGPMDGSPQPFSGQYVLHEFGKVVSQAERERIMESFIDLALEMHLPPVVMAEEWDPPHDRRVRLPNGEIVYARDPKWTYETILGIGEGWGRWSAEIECVNEMLIEEDNMPPVLLQRVTPNDWRDEMFGPRRPRETEPLKITAQRYFKGVFGYDVSDDIAEAGCISLFATTAPAVASAVVGWRESLQKPKARKKRRA